MVEHHIPQKCLQGTTTTTVITTTTRITVPLLRTAKTLFLEFQTQTVSPLPWMASQWLYCFQVCLWQAGNRKENSTCFSFSRRICFLLLLFSFVPCADETRFSNFWLCYGVAGFGVRLVFHRWTNTQLVTDTESLPLGRGHFFVVRIYLYSFTSLSSSTVVFCWSAQLAFIHHCFDLTLAFVSGH